MLPYIEQTNRTILFDEINPNKNNIFTLIGDIRGKESLSDDEIKEIDDKLTVTSFSDFLIKFNPAIYMILDLEAGYVDFTMETPTKNQSETIRIKLGSDHKLISMLEEILNANPHRSALNGCLSDMADCLIPKQDKNIFIQLRREIKECFLSNHINEVETILETITSSYNSSLLQLQLFLDECKTYLLQTKKEAGEIVNLHKVTNSQITVLEISKKFIEMEPVIPKEKSIEFEQYLKEYLESHKVRNGQYLLFNLLASCGNNNNLAEDCCELYNRSLDFYAGMIALFWRRVSPLIQTILGIRTFFEQYTVEQGSMPPVLLISNCSMELLRKEKYRLDLRLYLETVNLKSNYESTIWYAIIPRIKFSHLFTKRLSRERFQGKEQEEEIFDQPEDAVLVLMEILSHYRIQIFFSTYASNNNNLRKFAENGMQLFEESFKPFEQSDYLEYLIPCMPNFTIIPKEHCKLTLGRKFIYEEFGENNIALSENKVTWLGGIYVEASFVAAGLFAACQCPVYLQSKYPGKINPNMQGVAYRIMEADNRSKTATTMKKELFLYSKERLSEIALKGYGVVFGPDQKKITVLTDRPLSYLHGSKDCIATVQTKTYLERMIRHTTQDYKLNLIHEFFKNRPDSIYSQWMKNKSMMNSIIREGETINYNIYDKEHTCVIEIGFNEIQTKEKVSLSR